ncbi:MAG: aspartate-semialdehyde dehydrogenase [bacterium]
MSSIQPYRVGILGATGAVGMRFVSMLSTHPWFKIHKLMASERSVGKPYRQAVNWMLPQEPETWIQQMIVEKCEPDDSLDMVFSSLPASEAAQIETEFASEGIPVVSNSSAHRMAEDVPLIIPEINSEHLAMLEHQRCRLRSRGYIVANPNCSTIALSLGLDPVHRKFGIRKILVSTAQAVSGAGVPGLSMMAMLDNTIPYILGEESKLETEPKKIFGRLEAGKFKPADMTISAGCTRVAVRDGHLMHVSFTLSKHATENDILECWRNYRPEIQDLQLPNSPEYPVIYLNSPDRPQPLLDRDRGSGMTVSVGRLRPCPVMDWKCVILGHNTVRGAAGGAILLAELLAKKGFIGRLK